ncbi:MAG: TonB-dependent receptor [Calditrichaceae bacterium]|nr:TonB-dependent receptor [Calditrichaceae bacterium]MBN2710790.1 TonB-dependent receptor [Calditrichaceae bacterium]RQV94710.1 MAG: TonB-dependent receptor [Calditrichota bacterium]
MDKTRNNHHKIFSFRFKYLVIAVFVIINAGLMAQDTTLTYDLEEEIVVTAGRYPTAFKNVARSISIINETEISALPVNSIQEIIQYCPGVDLKQRGPAGVQADIGIRGSSFEQTLVLIDGVRVNDPQTGHHNLNIPVPMSNVSRIEILKGPGSRFYGPNALGGVINIITTRQKEPSVFVSALAGDFGLYDTEFSSGFSAAKVFHSLAIQKSGSNGYRQGTDFNNWSAMYSARCGSENHHSSFTLSYMDKQFGAGGFYASNFPDQWEHTKTIFMQNEYGFKIRNLNLQPRVFWRMNKDKFLLERGNPDFYQNNHQTDIYGADVQAEYISSIGVTGVGIEYSREKINSSGLGKHERDKTGLFLEQQMLNLERINLTLGVAGFYYSGWGWKAWPGMDVSYRINHALRIYGSANKAFRPPTFTELYYNSPADQGNLRLKPEESMEIESGFIFVKERLNFSACIFKRNSKNLIDWVRLTEQDKWTAMNITKMDMKGFELATHVSPSGKALSGMLREIRLSYNYLQAGQSLAGYQSKYVLNYLKHQFIAGINHTLALNHLNANWQIRYEDRLNSGKYWLADAKINYDCKPFQVFLEATNLFNQTYHYFSAVNMPGRWIKLGINYKLSFDMKE